MNNAPLLTSHQQAMRRVSRGKYDSNLQMTNELKKHTSKPLTAAAGGALCTTKVTP